MQKCSLELILSRTEQDAKGVERKAAGPRKHEDLQARGMQNCSLELILNRMLGELTGTLWASEHKETCRPEACRTAALSSF